MVPIKRFLAVCLCVFSNNVLSTSQQPSGLDNLWVSKIFSDTMWTFAPHSALNSECTQQGRTYLEHLSNNTHWAIRMLDASLITPSGLIAGEDVQFGHPEQCVQTRVPLPNFTSKYCLPTATFSPYMETYPEFHTNKTRDWPPYDVEKNVWDFIRPRDPFIRYKRDSFQWGLCVPESCTTEDIQTSLNKTLSMAFAKHRIHFHVQLTDVMCYSAAEMEARQMPPAGHYWKYVWLVLIVASVLGTIVDYQNPSKAQDSNLGPTIPITPQCNGNCKSTSTDRTSKSTSTDSNGHSKSTSTDEDLKIPTKVPGVTLVFTSCVATLVPPVLALLRGSPPKSCDTQPFKSDDNVSLIPERLKSFLLVFSIPRNVSNLFSRKGILLIDGLKGLGIVCTIVFHREIFGLAYAKNLEYFEEGIHSLSFCLLTASTFLLDIFFFFSGYLLAWPIIENLNRKRTVNFFNIIVNRVFRLYPMYLMMIWFSIFVLPYISQGPLWKSYANTEAEYCRQCWWQNVLFVSTLFRDNEICIPSSWYLSTEFQLFLIGLSLIYWVTKAPAWRTRILVLAFILAHLIPSIVIYFNGETSFWHLSIKDFRHHARAQYFRFMNNPFYIRMPPYIFGICAAYMTDALVRMDFKFSVIQKTVIFWTSLSSMFAIIYLGAHFLLPGHAYNVWEHVTFAIPFRFVLGSGLAMGVIIEHCGGYGAASDFFSHPIWVVLGRLSYHIYLFNFFTIPWDLFMSEGFSSYNMYIFILRFLGDLGLVTLLAFFTTILLEGPMTELRKKLMPPQYTTR
ncbi:hypothetical protein M8J76_016078 [Diaphorina citri]|nr:hypothetical protein M8J76_016078 [Diaphorina citri]